MKHALAIFLLFISAAAIAQQVSSAPDAMAPMNMNPANLVQTILLHDSSGTSVEPASTPAPMLMTVKHGWTLMFHASVFVVDVQETGPRGGDKFFSTNWFMGMAQHRLGPGTFTGRAMLSLEPATVTGRQYPLLFQQGETAYGKPIADGQHPHDFFMELAAIYDVPLGEKSLLSLYVAPVGDPASGPVAFPHRDSASEDPLAPLGHHQEDSTHIAYNVITAGATHGMFRIEACGFHGREPDESRWGIQPGPIDSWATRLTVQPGKDWSGEYSYAQITSPEALFPNDNQARMTASVIYNRPLHDGNWASTAIWGRTRSTTDTAGAPFNSFDLESTLRFRRSNYLWTRIESVDRSNLLVLGENPLPPDYQETRVARVEAYTLGYDRDIKLVPHLESAAGVQFATYGVPETLQPIYGAHPLGVAMFVRLRPVN